MSSRPLTAKTLRSFDRRIKKKPVGDPDGLLLSFYAEVGNRFKSVVFVSEFKDDDVIIVLNIENIKLASFFVKDRGIKVIDSKPHPLGVD